MSSRFRLVEAAGVLALLALVGCEREERQARGAPLPESPPGSITLTDLYAGQPSPPPSDPRAREYEGNAFHIAQGQRYFTWYNCTGCHANGGGGIGPPLMDEVWRYGGEIENIHATVLQGRPNGMPSFREKIPEQQIWQIAAYVRSLSGNTAQDATPSRNDAMQSIPPLNQRNVEAPVNSAPASSTVQGNAPG